MSLNLDILSDSNSPYDNPNKYMTPGRLPNLQYFFHVIRHPLDTGFPEWDMDKGPRTEKFMKHEGRKYLKKDAGTDLKFNPKRYEQRHFGQLAKDFMHLHTKSNPYPSIYLSKDMNSNVNYEKAKFSHHAFSNTKKLVKDSTSELYKAQPNKFTKYLKNFSTVISDKLKARQTYNLHGGDRRQHAHNELINNSKTLIQNNPYYHKAIHAYQKRHPYTHTYFRLRNSPLAHQNELAHEIFHNQEIDNDPNKPYKKRDYKYSSYENPLLYAVKDMSYVNHHRLRFSPYKNEKYIKRLQKDTAKVLIYQDTLTMNGYHSNIQHTADKTFSKQSDKNALKLSQTDSRKLAHKQKVMQKYDKVLNHLSDKSKLRNNKQHELKSKSTRDLKHRGLKIPQRSRKHTSTKPSHHQERGLD